MMQPSEYQQSILRWINDGSGDAIVEAVAGSGKTTTLRMLWQSAKALGGEAIFLAFNRAIAEELRMSIDGLRVSTIHALGHRLLQRHVGGVRLDDRKYKRLAIELVQGSRRVPQKELSHVSRDLAALAHFARITLTDPSDLGEVRALVKHHRVVRYPRHAAFVEKSLGLLPLLLQRGLRQVGEGTIDYTDMVWAPTVLKLSYPAFAWTFVDEAQDLNAAQVDLVCSCRAPDGRIVFVGDRAQAIYGFQGADPESMDRIARKLNPTSLPLSITYRCPRSHVDVAKRIVPAITARDNAPDGVLRLIDPEEAIGQMRPGDLVLSRNRNPLLYVWNRLQKRSVDAWVEAGEDKGLELLRALQYYEGVGTAAASLSAALEEDAFAYSKDEDEEQASLLWLLHSVVSGASGDYAELREYLDSAFTVKPSGVRCMTIHGAKGLEADRVFLVRPDLLPDKRALGWEYDQEENLLYVALTRSKNELFVCNGFLDGEFRPKGPPASGVLGTQFSRLRADPPHGVEARRVTPAGLIEAHRFIAGVCANCGKSEQMVKRFAWKCH